MSGDAAQGNLDPNLRASDPRTGNRYPSPFFDVGQQYIPPTTKELFKWVYFYATNNIFVGPALRKIARYPVTDLIFEDDNASICDYWKSLSNNVLKMKQHNMDTNFDLLTYGNGFVTISYPFSRFLICPACTKEYPWKELKKRATDLKIKAICKGCGYDGEFKIKDVSFKSDRLIRLVRINPEFIDIKYNDATGKHTYLYSIPEKLRRALMSGDLDILEDTPKIYIDAVKQKKKIKLNSQNLFHLKTPSISSKDMGWGLPLMSNALKDLYHFYVLRRGQEAIINEHITPLDVIFPAANGKFDPYVHSNLSNWKREIERNLQQKRRDPNFKAVVPFPIGFQRIGGDGKSMMLTPEMDFLAKTIIGSMGIPQEFVYGGSMQWSGSSISLRTLENDFLYSRTQLLQMNIWVFERIRIYLGIPTPRAIKFSDFKMADDIQKLNILLDMAREGKISWETMLKEMGFDPEIELRKIKHEQQDQGTIQQTQLLMQTEAQIKAQQLQARAAQQATEDQQATQEAAQKDQAVQQEPDQNEEAMRQHYVLAFAKRLLAQDPKAQKSALESLAKVDKVFAKTVASTMDQLAEEKAQAESDSENEAQKPMATTQSVPLNPTTPAGNGIAQAKPTPGGVGKVDTRPAPTQKPPRRQGGI